MELPEEIIFEILLRLPVRSLLTFRCVSKSWLSLLSSIHFNKTHVKFFLNNRRTTNHHRLAVVASVSGLGRSCHVYNMGSEKSFEHVCPARSLTLSARILGSCDLTLSARILGSCNGLICLTNDLFTLMLWNPCTGKSYVFPDSMVQNKGGCYVRHGFGYNASIDDYKVVKMFSFPQTEGKHDNIVQVYSLKANSWSTIQGFNSGFISGKLGVFVNGALHWEVCHSHCSSESWEIVTLDLSSDKYGKIALPGYKDGGNYWTLGVSRGYLVACCNYDPNGADMWVIKEYGVQKLWTKIVTITPPVGRRAYITPVFVAENEEEVLLNHGSDLTLYNSKNTSFKRLDNFRQAQVATYYETLASPQI